MITGVGKSRGLYPGFIATTSSLSTHARSSRRRGRGHSLPAGHRQISGLLPRLHRRTHSIVWLQDISGFDIRVGGGENRVLGYGSNLLYKIRPTPYPMITVLLRKASARATTPCPACPTIRGCSWPLPFPGGGEEGRTLAIRSLRHATDENFNIIATDAKKAGEDPLRHGRRWRARMHRDMDPYRSARSATPTKSWRLPEIPLVSWRDPRMSFRAPGIGGVKTPASGSLHDLLRPRSAEMTTTLMDKTGPGRKTWFLTTCTRT